jgi:hypothetical protein
MFLALRSGKPVNTRTEKGDSIQRVYFLDMAMCLDPTADREDAVISVPAVLKKTSDFGRRVDLNLSTDDLQFAQRMFPLFLMFDAEALMKWEMGYAQHYVGSSDAAMFLFKFKNAIWLAFQQFKVPAIEMSVDTPREAVCQVFEKVNQGGVSLTVFELMTATFAADEFLLRDDWAAGKRGFAKSARSWMPWTAPASSPQSHCWPVTSAIRPTRTCRSRASGPTYYGSRSLASRSTRPPLKKASVKQPSCWPNTRSLTPQPALCDATYSNGRHLRFAGLSNRSARE